MERDTLKDEDMDGEILIQFKDNILQVFTLNTMTEEEIYVLLVAAVQGFQATMESKEGRSSLH